MLFCSCHIRFFSRLKHRPHYPFQPSCPHKKKEKKNDPLQTIYAQLHTMLEATASSLFSVHNFSSSSKSISFWHSSIVCGAKTIRNLVARPGDSRAAAAAALAEDAEGWFPRAVRNRDGTWFEAYNLTFAQLGTNPNLLGQFCQFFYHRLRDWIRFSSGERFLAQVFSRFFVLRSLRRHFSRQITFLVEIFQSIFRYLPRDDPHAPRIFARMQMKLRWGNEFHTISSEFSTI